MPWSKYKGISTGRLIQWIYHYCGIRIAESVVFGYEDGWIRLHGRPFAKVTWSEDDVPHFTFSPEWDWVNKVQYQKKAAIVQLELRNPNWESYYNDQIL